MLKWYSALMVLIMFLILDICVCTPVSNLLKSVSYFIKDVAKKCHLNSEVSVLVCSQSAQICPLELVHWKHRVKIIHYHQTTFTCAGELGQCIVSD